MTTTSEPVAFEALRNSVGMQTISLHLAPERDTYVDVRVGGRLLDCDVAWDLLALVASSVRPGGYYLGTCCCGAHGCAGVWKPIEVRHDGDSVTWTVPIPYVHGGGADSILLRFDAAQYRAETQSLLADFKRAVDSNSLARLVVRSSP
jgi:hypothetical protein